MFEDVSLPLLGYITTAKQVIKTAKGIDTNRAAWQYITNEGIKPLEKAIRVPRELKEWKTAYTRLRGWELMPRFIDTIIMQGLTYKFKVGSVSKRPYKISCEETTLGRISDICEYTELPFITLMNLELAFGICATNLAKPAVSVNQCHMLCNDFSCYAEDFVEFFMMVMIPNYYVPQLIRGRLTSEDNVSYLELLKNLTECSINTHKIAINTQKSSQMLSILNLWNKKIHKINHQLEKKISNMKRHTHKCNTCGHCWDFRGKKTPQCPICKSRNVEVLNSLNNS